MSHLFLETRIGLDGNPCPEHLAADNQKLVVTNGHQDKKREWRFDQIDGFRLAPLIGSCFVQAQVDGRWLTSCDVPGAPIAA